MAAPPLPPPNLRAVAAAKARQYGVPVQVFLRQIQQESGFNPNARSSAGAQGIAQFIPSTARSYGLTNPFNAVASLDAAARYDADLLHRYGTIQRALSAYNSGRPDAYQDPHFAGGQTYRYVHDILGGAPAQTTLPPPPGTTGAPQGLPSALVPPPPPRQGLSPQLLSLFNQGNEMFGLPALPQSFGSAPQQVAAGTAAQPSPSSRGAAPPTLKGKKAVNLAAHLLGIPYAWGGESLKGFDCSGLLQYVWAKQGVQIPRTTYDQFKQGQPVGANQLQPGDAVFFKGSDSRTENGKVLPGHVGIYIGGGRIIEAPHTGSNVRISALQGRTDFMGGRRYQ